jgi:hypothetical protein
LEPNSLFGCLGYITIKESISSMKNVRETERIISERWPKLKKSAMNEGDPEKLITILEEIDDLLFVLEARIKLDNEPDTYISPKQTQNENRNLGQGIRSQ